MTRFSWRLAVLALSASAVISVSAGQPGEVDPTFNPGRGALYVGLGQGNSVLVQPDGKILVTGFFNAVDLDLTPAAVRFNADGSLDSSFNASALPIPPGFVSSDDAPKALALQPNGQVLVAGAFVNSDGSARYLIRLNADGSLDPAFNPRIGDSSGSADVLQASVLSGGRILIGGRFDQIDGVPRNGIARLNTDGTLDETFNPVGASVSFVVQSTEKVVVNRGAQLVRLNPDGTLDNTFTTVAAPPHNSISRLIVEPGDKVIWTTIQSLGIIVIFPTTTISRLDADGNNDPTFQPFSSSGSNPLLLQADGKIIILGHVELYRLNGDGSPDYSFHPNVLGDSFAQQADGKLVTAGSLNREPYGVQRLFLDGSRDDSFAVGLGLTSIAASAIDQAHLLPNGKIVITGDFHYIDRIPRRKIAVLNADGTLDLNFDAEPFLRAYYLGGSNYIDLTVQPDGRILVDLEYELVRLNSDGGADKFFHYQPIAGYISTLALQPNGKILLSRTDGLVRLNSDGSADPAFHTSESGTLVSVQPDAKILLRGTYDLFRLNPDGTRDAGFNADGVRGFIPPSLRALQPDGRLLVNRFVGTIDPLVFVRLDPNGGIDQTFQPAFSPVGLAAADLTGLYVLGAVSGVPDQPELGRLFSDGSRDPNFAAVFNRGARINSLLLQPDGQLIVAGSFDHVNGIPRAGIARLNGAAPRKLANISTRVRVGVGQSVEIGGFIVAGNAPKKVIVRALGPSLGSNGLIGADLLVNPSLELHDSTGAVIAHNDDWRATQESEITASGIPPAENTEAAIVTILAPGHYTGVVQGRDGGEGLALAEVYDLDPASDSSLANISTRGFVNDNDGVMIAGFILRGSDPTTIIARAIGPSLVSLGITAALVDPEVTVHDQSGSIIAANDDWKHTQQAELEAYGMGPADDSEAALIAPLPPGQYTAVVRGANSDNGVGLVEIYHVE